MTHFAQEAAEYVKRCLGADEHCKIVFAGTGTTGAVHRLQEILGLTVPAMWRQRVLDGMDPDERPVDFVGPYEHHSNEISWRETIAEVVEIPLSADGGVDLGALRSELAKPEYEKRPKIGSFSAASNVTGRITDTRAVARILHEAGARAFFDFAASGPYVAIAMKPGEPDGYDAVFLSPHKFMGGPDTPGVLVFHESLYHLAAPSIPGGGTVSYVSRDTQHYVEDIEAREDGGTPAIIQKMRTALAFWVKEQVGADVIASREETYIRRAIARLRSNPRVEILGNLDAPRIAVLSFVVRAGDHYLHPRLVVRLLNDLFGIQARGGCTCAGPYGHSLLGIEEEMSRGLMTAILAGYEGIKPGWTRISFHYSIPEEEFQFLLDAVEFVAQHGERFLTLYELDWATGAWRHAADGSPESLFDGLVEGNGGACPDDVDTDRGEAASLPRDPGPPPYADYLAEARRIAAALPDPSPHRLPPGVPPELVLFRP